MQRIIWFILWLTPCSILAGVGDWHSVTNKSQIEDIAIIGARLGAATNGGVLFINTNTGQIDASFTNTEGLSTNHAVRVAVDRQGKWWFGMTTGELNCFDPGSGRWEILSDFEGFSIKDLVPRGDSLFVALDIGVSLYLMDRLEAKETYKNLGDIQSNSAVGALAILRDMLWAGTEYGLAIADLNQINLKAPQSWWNLHVQDGLLSEEIKALSVYDEAVFIGSNAGVQKWENGHLTTYTNLPTTRIVQFMNGPGGFYLILRNHILLYDSQSDNWKPIFYSPENISCAAADESGMIWCGTEKNGIFRLNPDIGERFYVPLNQPGGNYFADLAVTPTGELWCATGSLFGAGVYRFDGQQWTNYSKASQELPADNTTAVAVDPDGSVWVGSWGRGLFHFTGDSIEIYNAQNGYLPGIPNDLGYAVVNSLAFDQTGTLWMTTFNAYNGNLLIARTREGEWVYFSPIDGILSANPLCIAVDQFNRKWVGTDGGGVYVYDDQFTPTDKSDDSFAGTLTTVDGLQGNRITALAIDEFNTVWIGSNNGLDFYQGGKVFPKYGLITNDINCLEIDPVGNLWVGTSAGFSILDREELTFRHFTQENSPLVSKNVLSVAFDGKTGMAYIGTTNGMSLWETLFTAPAESITLLNVFPNPLIINGEGSESLIVDGLARDAAVNVYSSSGKLVRRLVAVAQGGRAVWDGRDDRGDWVASGVYLIVAAQADGAAKSAKVIVIKR